MTQTVIATPGGSPVRVLDAIGAAAGKWFVWCDDSAMYVSSDDGGTWSEITPGGGVVLGYDMTVASDGTTWVVSDPAGHAASSTDLAAWTSITLPAGSYLVHYLNATWVTEPWFSTTIKVATSSDTVSWTTVDTGLTESTEDRRTIAYFDGAWFVAVEQEIYRGASLAALTATTGNLTTFGVELYADALGLYATDSADVTQWNTASDVWNVSSAIANGGAGFAVRDGEFLSIDYDGTMDVYASGAWTAVDLAYYAPAGPQIRAVASDGTTLLLFGGGYAGPSVYDSYAYTEPPAASNQVTQAAGSLATRHGTATVVYDQSGVATGKLATLHGVAVSLSRLPSGMTICAALGEKEARHGQAVGVSSFVSAAAGHLAATHGFAQGKTSYAATGKLSIAHGTASLSSLFHATGHRATKHGIATTLLSRAMTGHLATKHGTMASEWKAIGQMTGHLATQHGAASSKCVFRVSPSFKTRHGTHKTIRSITC